MKNNLPPGKAFYIITSSMSSVRIAQNLEMVREKVKNRCLKNGMDPSKITIVGISKSHPAQFASEAVAAGLIDLGENKVQEAAEKIPLVNPRPLWHLVGHLQTNKVKKAVEIFDLIQSIDSLEVAEMISSVAIKMGKMMQVYVQVNSSGESQKSGFQPAPGIAERNEGGQEYDYAASSQGCRPHDHWANDG